MKIRAVLASAAFAAGLATGPAIAACSGDNLIETMTGDERAALAEAVAAHPYPEGNFWVAERPGSVVHVAGTLHVSDPRLDPFKEKIAPFVASADIVVLEMTEEAQAETNRMMTETPGRMFLEEGPTLIDLLGEDWPELEQRLAARGVPGFLAAKFQPWFAALLLSVPDCAMASLQNPDEGFDRTIELAAIAAGIERAALDTPDVLFDLIGDRPLDEQIEMLRTTIDMGPQVEDQFSTTLDSYFAERHRELWELSRIGMEDKGFEEIEATLLIARNESWAEKLPALIDGRNAVVAVGAAHLSGETGVLRTLEKLGYTLSRF